MAVGSTRAEQLLLRPGHRFVESGMGYVDKGVKGLRCKMGPDC